MSVATSLQTQFFSFLFDDDEGYVCIATAKPKAKDSFKQHFFQWPEQREQLIDFIETNTIGNNLWFCVNLLAEPKRQKQYCLPGRLVWADLDTAQPHEVTPNPQCVIESSPGRFQGVWRTNRVLDPYEAERYSKRIAYTYSVNGSDKSGWDLTQLLRIPLTNNYKYNEAPKVVLSQVEDDLLDPSAFDLLDEAEDTDEATEIPSPKLDTLPNPEQVLLKFWPTLRTTGFVALYEEEPQEDWSRSLWRFLLLCFEAGMNEEEAYAMALQAKCNKYVRDKRPLSHLWRDVIRASAVIKRTVALTGVGAGPGLFMPTLVEDDEDGISEDTVIFDYIKWATASTDARPEYHELCAYMLLSSLTAAGLKLKTSYDTFMPNLWGLVLGNSTLTRKTTAMKMVVEIIYEIDRDIILATDGSVEGILSGLAGRPKMVSMYFRDEVGGFFDAISKKEYLAGMPELFARLYDVPPVETRRLRKETITVVEPVFIFFGGGIRDKVYSLVSEQHILSGFLPRFLIVSGDADLKTIRTTGPPTEQNNAARDEIRTQMARLYAQFNQRVEMEIPGGHAPMQVSTEVVLTPEAWTKYKEIEFHMLETASESHLSGLALPTYERLSRSVLKMSMLTAASYKEPEDLKIIVDREDVVTAARFAQRWGRHTVDLLLNSGRSQSQQLMEKVLHSIREHPGVLRGKIMQWHGLDKKTMDNVQATLEERGQIHCTKQGRATFYNPVV